MNQLEGVALAEFCGGARASRAFDPHLLGEDGDSSDRGDLPGRNPARERLQRSKRRPPMRPSLEAEDLGIG
jgi:hypothetical protein